VQAASGTGPGGAGQAASGPPLSSAEIDTLHREIAKCWTVGSASTDTLRSVVTLTALMKQDGSVDRVTLVSADGPTEAAKRTAFEIASRTVKRCARNGALPADKYEQWREITMEFDYNAMRLR
jgi:hypothetical protein